MNVKGKKFWEIRAQGDGSADLLLYGPIGNGGWSEDEVSPKQFKEDLDALGDIQTLNLYINSAGGDVFAAQAIYSMLKRYKAKVITYIDGLAASAASLVAMAGERVIMPINAMLMIHDPWAVTIGNSGDHRKMADELDQIRRSMVAVYAAKTGLAEKKIIELLEAETWFTAEEAVEQGFADEVQESKQIAASLDGKRLTLNGVEFDVGQFKNLPKMKFDDNPLAGDKSFPVDQVGNRGGADAEGRETQARLRFLRARTRL